MSTHTHTHTHISIHLWENITDSFQKFCVEHFKPILEQLLVQPLSLSTDNLLLLIKIQFVSFVRQSLAITWWAFHIMLWQAIWLQKKDSKHFHPKWTFYRKNLYPPKIHTNIRLVFRPIALPSDFRSWHMKFPFGTEFGQRDKMSLSIMVCFLHYLLAVIYKLQKDAIVNILSVSNVCF